MAYGYIDIFINILIANKYAPDDFIKYSEDGNFVGLLKPHMEVRERFSYGTSDSVVTVEDEDLLRVVRFVLFLTGKSLFSSFYLILYYVIFITIFNCFQSCITIVNICPNVPVESL